MESLHSLLRMHWDHEPEIHKSLEISKRVFRFMESKVDRNDSPHLAHPHGSTAVVLRRADFNPLLFGSRKSAGSGMNSALQVHRSSINSIAVPPERVFLSLPCGL